MNPDWDQTLTNVFREEAGEILPRLVGGLIELETTETGPLREKAIQYIFRLAHNLKGSAASVGFSQMAELAHSLESSLDLVRRGKLQPGRELIDAALKNVDLLQMALNRELSPEEVRLGCSVIEQVVQGTAPKAAAAGPPKGKKKRDPIALLSEAVTELIAALAEASRSGSAEALVTAERISERLASDPSAARGSHFAKVAAMLANMLSRRREGKVPPSQAVDAALLAADFLKSEVTGSRSDEDARTVESMLSPKATPESVRPPEEPPKPSPESVQAPPKAPAPQPPAADSVIAAETSVRISIALLDAILYRLDELVALKLRVEYQQKQVEDIQELINLSFPRTQSRVGAPSLEELKRRVESVRRDLAHEVHLLGALAQGLHEDVKEVRMVPIGPMLDPFRRVVRELGHSLGKEAALEIHGEDVRVDKRLLDMIRDPLNHLLRNAVDHGLEEPEERKKIGKPARGRILISAEARESHVWLEVTDDGRGIDPDRVRAAAVRKGLIDANRAQSLTTREVLNFIFAPGFSTASDVTQTSGRGVGLDVVRDNVGRLGGRIEFYSDLGKGTEFILSLPLTLSASRGLLVMAGKQQFCIPLTTIDEVVHLDPSEMGMSHGRLAIQRRNQTISFALLADILSGHGSGKPEKQCSAVIIALSERRLAVGVDEVVGQEELVVKALSAGSPKLHFVVGATSLADGRLVTVLDPRSLVEAGATAGPYQASRPDTEARTVLVVDDSLTSRTMVASVLERAGYQTLLAHDGESALNLLRQQKVSLVVSDVEMTGMDGLTLVRRIRSTSQVAQLPVILLTSMGGTDDRARGAGAGASAYIVKKDFDPSVFLGMVTDYIGRAEETG